MFSFRQKIFVTYVFVFLVFIAMIFPFAQTTVKDIVRKGMEDRATELIHFIQGAENNDGLIRMLKEAKPRIFFRVSLITNELKVLYDPYVKRELEVKGKQWSQQYQVDHPEVLKAFREGTGYAEDYSEILNQDFAYFAKAFNFHGKRYVLRTAFPLQYVEEMTHDFEFGFLGSAIAILLLFSVMTWFIINYLTRPIQQIISAIKPYQEGVTHVVPQVTLKPSNRTDEFGQLACTLNSLSVRIQKQIDSITEERNEKEAVLESLVEGVIAVDKRMFITFFNSMAAKILGLRRHAVLDRHASCLKEEKCITLLDMCQKKGEILTETLQLKRDGETFYFDLVAAPKMNKTGAILVIQDKSEHYRIIEMRKDFIANASHELKTPITIIRGFAEALHDNPELGKEIYFDITSKIVNNCEKMNTLIKDLLTLTDIEHIPESRLVSCDLLTLAVNAQHTVQDAYSDASIALNVIEDEEHPLVADPNLIELALANLIENAAKYSKGSAEITITVGKEQGQYKIAIADKGIGIPKKDLEYIFQRFYRVDKSRAKKINGTGLGLSIVETIIAKHFGSITVDSVEGEGSTFTIYLPIQRKTASVDNAQNR